MTTQLTSKQIREEFFSIMCEVVAYYTQVDADVASGKIEGLYSGTAKQKALIYGRDKAFKLFNTQIQAKNEGAYKVQAIKALAELTGCSLSDAKEFYDTKHNFSNVQEAKK